MRSLTSFVAGAALLAMSATTMLPTNAEAFPVVSPSTIEAAALPVEQTAFYGRRLCFRRFGWHGPGLYRCHRWWRGDYGYGGYGFGGGRRFGGGRGGFGGGRAGGHGGGHMGGHGGGRMGGHGGGHMGGHGGGHMGGHGGGGHHR